MKQPIDRNDRRRRVGAFRSALLVGVAVGFAGCADLGFSDRVLWHVPSPDAQMLAVCQEVPAFDGPGYAIRLERSDGTILRRLYESGDGDPCSEMAWSPDGRILAVLSGHVARVTLVDVAWALGHPASTTAHWSWRQVSFGNGSQPLNAAGLHFVGPLEVELQLCPAERGIAQPNGRRTCGQGAATHRFDVLLPIVSGHEARWTGAAPGLGSFSEGT
jgi:hypothetical protein